MNSAKHIADRIRLMIATKQFQVNEVLPSTRELGKQLEVSFHTVRKAYLELQKEGIIRSERGRGFLVSRQNTSLDKADRIERGAEKVRVLLEELVGYGLDEEEIETIFEEQLSYLEWPERLNSCAVLGMTPEHAEMLSTSIKQQIGVKSAAIGLSDKEESVNYDALFIPINTLQSYRSEMESGKVIPIVYSINPEVLLQLVERHGLGTIALVTREEQSIPVLVEELKAGTRFSGTILAGALYGKSLPLFVRDVDLVVYTSPSAYIVERQIPEKKRLLLNYLISDVTSTMIRSELWDQ